MNPPFVHIAQRQPAAQPKYTPIASLLKFRFGQIAYLTDREISRRMLTQEYTLARPHQNAGKPQRRELARGERIYRLRAIS